MSLTMTLLTKDNKTLIVNDLAITIYMINNNMKENSDGHVICPFDYATLSKVIEYQKFHAPSDVSDGDMKAFDKNFVKEDQSFLYDIYGAAVSFEIQGLMELVEPSREQLWADFVALDARRRATMEEASSSRKKTKKK